MCMPSLMSLLLDPSLMIPFSPSPSLSSLLAVISPLVRRMLRVMPHQPATSWLVLPSLEGPSLWRAAAATACRWDAYLAAFDGLGKRVWDRTGGGVYEGEAGVRG